MNGQFLGSSKHGLVDSDGIKIHYIEVGKVQIGFTNI